MIAFAIVLLAALIFWVCFVCWHSVTVFREQSALPRKERLRGLAKWAIRILFSGFLWPGIGVAASTFAPSGSLLAGQSGQRLYLAGMGIGLIALAVGIVLTLAAPDSVEG